MSILIEVMVRDTDTHMVQLKHIPHHIRGDQIYAVIYLNPGHEENGEDPHLVSFTDSLDDVYDIIRKFGEEQVMNILYGQDICDATEEVLANKPKCFLVEISI